LEEIKLTNDELSKYHELNNLTEEQKRKLADFLSLFAVTVYNSMK